MKTEENTVSETPRTDGVVIPPDRSVTSEYNLLECHARTLERELADAQARIKALSAEVETEKELREEVRNHALSCQRASNAAEAERDALKAEVEALKGQKAEQFRLYCEETKKHNATAAELTKARKHAEWCSAKLTEHAEAAGINPDDLNFISKTLSAIIATWAENSSLKVERDALKGLLMAACKWVRMVHERRDEVSQWMRHGADPAPLLKEIEAALAQAGPACPCECENGIIRSLGRDNEEHIEDCPHCRPTEGAKPAAQNGGAQL